MEERRPPLVPTKNHRPLPLPPALETYVVQIPRDQVYRIPPPEHARIIERYITENAKKPSTIPRKILLWVTVAPLVIVAVALITILSVRATLYSPELPEFVVDRIQAKNMAPEGKLHRQPEFDVGLRARSPNKRFSVSYGGGLEIVSLVYKNKVIGKGKIRSKIRRGPGGGNVDFPIVLSGNEKELSPAIKKGLTGAMVKAMELKMEVAVEYESWLRSDRKNIMVSCDFDVKNSLASNNKISFQECTSSLIFN